MFLLNLKSKTIAIIAAVVFVLALVFVVWWQYNQLQERNAQLKSQTVEMQRLKDDIVRSKSEYVSKKDLKEFAKESNIDLKPIEKDLKELNADIKGITKTVARTPGVIIKEVASTKEEPRGDKPEPITVECPDGNSVECPNQDKFGYQSSTQVLKLEEPFKEDKKIPFGEAKFSVWRAKPWDLRVEPREYKSVTVLSQNEEGRHFTHTKLSVNVDGEEYSLPVADSQFVERLPTPKFRWDPSLYMGIHGGAIVSPEFDGEVMPNLFLTLFSHGYTKVNPTWTFLGVGLGYEIQQKNLGFLLSPVNFNVGKPMPLIDNLYIGPMVTIDLKKNIGILGGLSVGL